MRKKLCLKEKGPDSDSLEILPMRRMKTKKLKSFALNNKAVYLMAHMRKEYHLL